MKIESIPINNWSDLEEHNSEKYIYRGQRNAHWTFKSSLERLCISMNIDLIYAHIIEKNIVSEFKRRYNQYSTHIIENNDNLEWLSIMRHHMAPTRLLDWNYSIYIALYFALECECDKNKDKSTEEGSAIWCMNSKWAHDECKNKLLSYKAKYKKDIENICNEPSYGISGNSFTNIFLIKPFIDTVYPISPRNITQRISVQKGLFLCPGNPNHSFDKNIENMDSFDKQIKKLFIPKEKRIEYLKKLYEMNITRATLFPGLDGFARSLSVYHHFFEHKNILSNTHNKSNCAWGMSK